jgi:mycoredoxin
MIQKDPPGNGDMNFKLIVYGHQYCADALYLDYYLDKNGIEYEWRDVMDGEPSFRQELRLLAAGNLSVPTVVFPDGEVLVEPAPKDVLARWARAVR